MRAVCLPPPADATGFRRCSTQMPWKASAIGGASRRPGTEPGPVRLVGLMSAGRERRVRRRSEGCNSHSGGLRPSPRLRGLRSVPDLNPFRVRSITARTVTTRRRAHGSPIKVPTAPRPAHNRTGRRLPRSPGDNALDGTLSRIRHPICGRSRDPRGIRHYLATHSATHSPQKPPAMPPTTPPMTVPIPGRLTYCPGRPKQRPPIPRRRHRSHRPPRRRRDIDRIPVDRERDRNGGHRTPFIIRVLPRRYTHGGISE